MPGFSFKIWTAVMVMLLVCHPIFAFPSRPSAAPAPLISTDQEQLQLVRARYEQWNRRNCQWMILIASLGMFGAICALWANSEYRSPLLWFIGGFLFNVLAFLMIWMICRRHHGKKRYRRVISYWHVSR